MMLIRVIPNHTKNTSVKRTIIHSPLTRMFHSLDHWPACVIIFLHMCVCFQMINTRICSRKHSGFLESLRDRRIMALGGFVNRSHDVRWHFLCALLWNVPSSVKWWIRAVDLNRMRRVIWRFARCSLNPWILRCKSMKTDVFFYVIALEKEVDLWQEWIIQQVECRKGTYVRQTPTRFKISYSGTSLKIGAPWTLKCRNNVVNFLQKPHNKHPIARRPSVWFTFYCCYRCADGNIMMNYTAL